jgi:hypothetical protein
MCHRRGYTSLILILEEFIPEFCSTPIIPCPELSTEHEIVRALDSVLLLS